MAAVRARGQAAVGSRQWAQNERNQANDFVVQEVEEFAFSARNEMDWLNEHMADIFNGKQLDVAEVFKTPGKLRGKTPRAARPRNLLEQRAPLTDVFNTNLQASPSPSGKPGFHKQTAGFQVAEDKDDAHITDTASPARFSLGAGKENTDSGYHGMSADEMEVEPSAYTAPSIVPKSAVPQYLLSPLKQTHHKEREPSKSPSRNDSQDTFVSAKEEAPRDGPATGKDSNKHDNITTDNEEIESSLQQKGSGPARVISEASTRYSVSASTAAGLDDALEQAERESPTKESVDSGNSSAFSEASSPERPVVRKKSSLTFAALPAREPLTTKKSVGARPSRTSQANALRTNAGVQDNRVEKEGSGFALNKDAAPTESGQLPEDFHDADMNTETEKINRDIEEASQTTKLHNTTSTQRLQERLALLGKSNAPRASKSIPSNPVVARPAVQRASQEPSTKTMSRPGSSHDNEESWIAPITSRGLFSDAVVSDPMPTLQQPEELPQNNSGEPTKAAQQSPFHSDQDKSMPSYPPLPSASSTALNGSLELKNHALSHEQSSAENASPLTSSVVGKSEGPLSASKAKLFSVLKSAKGIFASSASVSAQAKMEALSTQSPNQRPRSPISSVKEAMHASPQEDLESKSLHSRTESHNVPMSKNAITLGSEITPTEPGKGAELVDTAKETTVVQVIEHEMHDVHLEKARAEERRKAALQKAEREQRAMQAESEDPLVASSAETHDNQEVAPPPPPKSQAALSNLQKNGEPRRPGRLPKESVAKAKPAPVSIKLASQRIGQVAGSTTSVAASQPEQAAPPVPPKQPTLQKKTSSSSIQTTASSQSFKTTATTASSRPKALEAAARKKEQDEREAQRKAEQKREMERRRAAKADEERRAAQEQKEAEQRANDAKQQAQKQAAEQRKADAIRRNDQLRKEAVARGAPTNEPTNAPLNERTQVQSHHQQGELGMTRPVSRMTNTADPQRPAQPHVNPAKPPKRQFNPDADDGQVQKPLPSRPGQAEQQGNKRRKTSEDSFAEIISRPTMAPPLRPSMMRKQEVPNKFTPGFMSTAGNSHNGMGVIKLVAQPQQPQHPPQSQQQPPPPQQQHPKTPHYNDLAKFSSARIPFAEAPNPPQQHQRVQQLAKTPGTAPKPKSSPQYPNGDSIDLPEIPTDSEDSDNEDDLSPKDWVKPENLEKLLWEQQRLNTTPIFGRPGPPDLDLYFKGNKERLAKFRNRTSSANWSGPDGLTDEERRKDREARERLEKNGAWTFCEDV